MEELLQELRKELEVELASELHTDADKTLLSLKIKGAYREIKFKRNYQEHHDDEFIDADMEKMFQRIKELALYDWNHIGGGGQSVKIIIGNCLLLSYNGSEGGIHIHMKNNSINAHKEANTILKDYINKKSEYMFIHYARQNCFEDAYEKGPRVISIVVMNADSEQTMHRNANGMA